MDTLKARALGTIRLPPVGPSATLLNIMRRLNLPKQFALVLILLNSAGLSRGAIPESLQRSAVLESLDPIRPGVPGKTPFWNEHAQQFIWAPAFEFPSVAGAASYRFTVTSESGPVRSFETNKPWAPLTPIWMEIPAGYATVKVEALDRRGDLMSLAGTRPFYRGAVFAGPYGKPILAYSESARIALAGVMAEPFVRSWATDARPSETYKLYRYASKLIGAVMTASALYARQSPSPADAQSALESGRKAADFLLSISAPAGTPLEYFPPTYHGATPGERENDNWTMLISPAEAGQGYLNLFDATSDRKYLEAAQRIAGTYRKTQLRSGTWPLKVDNRTGKPIAENELIPSVVISFLDRLVEEYRQPVHRSTRDRAVRWMLKKPARTFDWSAQFDDARLRKPLPESLEARGLRIRSFSVPPRQHRRHSPCPRRGVAAVRRRPVCHVGAALQF